MKKRKKYVKILRKYGYIFSVFCIFSAMGIGAFAKNLAAGQCSWEYIKTHLSEPFWEGIFQSEPQVISAKEEKEEKEAEEILAKKEKKEKEAEEIPAKEEDGKQMVEVEKAGKKETTKQKTEKQKEKNGKAGVTKFTTYKPVKVTSPYYTDRGKIPLTTEYSYETVSDTYFSDAAFIGDSRTLGLYDYSGWGQIADFYCESGFSLYQWTRGATVTCQNTGKKVDLKKALQSKTYGKVYLMIGMNDLGYGNSEKYAQWLSQMVEMVKETQPQAIIYLMGNLHMSREKNNKNTEFNNVNVNDKNVSMASLADGITSFYLDCNPIYTDKEGYLKSDLTFDGCHIYGYQYKEWTDFIKEHAVVKERK